MTKRVVDLGRQKPLPTSQATVVQGPRTSLAWSLSTSNARCAEHRKFW
jgi:hypothetical protein